LYTCHHILPDMASAAYATVAFNYETDGSGLAGQRSVYQLDASDFFTSPENELDYTRVKIKDDSGNPLSQWGVLEVETLAVPNANEPVFVVQHPGGDGKKIVLTGNEVVKEAYPYLNYSKGTLPGSSGAPVCNKDWRVVALHRAGHEIDTPQGRIPANQGVLMKAIFVQKSSTPIHHPAPPVQPVTMPTTTPSPVVNRTGIPLFVVIHTDADINACKKLNQHLAIMKRTKVIDVYNVYDVQPGEVIKDVINAKWQLADYVICVITPEFVGGDTTVFDAFETTMQAKGAGKTIIPLMFSKISLENTGLEALASLPSRSRSIGDFPTEEAAFTDIAQGIQALAKKWKGI
jgi:Trypsin-like peptidase domain